jgi:hypothetical protein
MIEYDLKGIDKTHYSEDIYEFVPNLVPLVQRFYDRFDVKISKVEYKSSWGKNEARIKFECDTNQPYCGFEIDTTNIGSAFLAPSKRAWHIVFSWKNVSREMSDIMYGEYDQSSLNIHYCKDDKKPDAKVESAIEEYDEWITSYFNHLRAMEIFLF